MGLSRWVTALNLAPAALLKFGTAARRHRKFSQRGWPRNSWLALGTLALMASARPALSESTGIDQLQRIGSGNPVAGKRKSEEERCQECHGPDGISVDEKIPNHAGQYAGYLIKQLNNFQSGARKHETMSIMAADLTSADMADIAAYFASQKIMQGLREHKDAQAENLFVNGDPARDIPSCASCHGENGKGRFADNLYYPVIGGQRVIYLRSQLFFWKLGDRKNSPDAVMNKIAGALGEAEIEELARYVSEL